MSSSIFLSVAPLVGAWIETGATAQTPQAPESHPSWVRGLKRLVLCLLLLAGVVAPLVGAWIETVFPYTFAKQQQSHPSWVRGLKPTT